MARAQSYIEHAVPITCRAHLSSFVVVCIPYHGASAVMTHWEKPLNPLRKAGGCGDKTSRLGEAFISDQVAAKDRLSSPVT
jgi:hypothetical protein